MSSAPLPSTEDNVIHGLNYPPDFLSSLPVLLPRPHPHTPIRALSASQFASIHHTAINSHAPDHVLFPFLHGLEGDNQQQNAFFSVTSDTPVVPPRFRGLIWAACEDDDTPSSDDGDDSDVVASDDDSDDDEPGSDGGDMGHSFALDIDMDIDTDLDLDHSPRPEAPSPPSISPSFGPLDPTCDSSDPNNAPHMHPVQPRAPRIYTNTAALSRDRSASASSSSTSSSSSQSLNIPSPSTPATSLPDSPPPSCFPLGPPTPEPRSHSAPLIASGFCPRDLLRQNADGNAEFVPLRVPDGISLRNFDIQLVRVLLCHVLHSCPLFLFLESALLDSSLHFILAPALPQVR